MTTNDKIKDNKLHIIYCGATWVTFKPKLKKRNKKMRPEKYFYILGDGIFLPQNNLIKLFKTF